jgi:hypothetical protein
VRRFDCDGRGPLLRGENSQLPIPFYDRVLLSYNEQAAGLLPGTGPQPAIPLDNDHMRDAANVLARAVRLRATVTLSNTGRSTAQNVSLKAADQYTPNKAMSTSQTSIPPGARLTYVFDGPADPAKQAAAADPSFPPTLDPTGPVDPAIVSLAVVVGVCAIVATFFIAIAGEDRCTEVSRPERKDSEAPTENLVGRSGDAIGAVGW